MDKIFIETMYFGIVLSLLSYWIAVQIRKKLPYPLFNPLLMSAIISITILMIFDIDFETYNQGAQMITFLLTPSTVCLAVPLYKQSQILKKHFTAIVVSLLAGCLAGMISIIFLCILLKADDILLFSLLPKSITTAIAIGVSNLIGGKCDYHSWYGNYYWNLWCYDSQNNLSSFSYYTSCRNWFSTWQ